MEGGVNMTTRNVTAADFGSRYEAPGAELVRIACQFQSRILLKSGDCLLYTSDAADEL